MKAKSDGAPSGSSFAANARKHAGCADVKAIVAQLQKPAREKIADAIAVNVDWATRRLLAVTEAPLEVENAKIADYIRAVEAMFKLHGINAPDKTALTLPAVGVARKGGLQASKAPNEQPEMAP
jgi:hypothetical protein